MRRVWTSAVALMGAMGFAQVSHAQEQVSQGDAPVSDEIVVTVQKREQALIDVPIALTAYNSEFIDNYGLDTLEEIATLVPGLEIQDQSPNNPGFAIRGITSDSTEANQEPRIAVFQDGVSISRAAGSAIEPFDLERIEVAKGPQPTLFGRGALIGGIDIIQNKARLNDFGGSVDVALGDYSSSRVVGVVNAPVIEDMLAVRLAGVLRERDGFSKNLQGGEDLGGVETKAARLAVRFDPTSALRIDAIFNYQDDATSGTAFKAGNYAPQGGDTSPFTALGVNTRAAFDNGRALGVEREVTSGTLIAAYDLSSALTLTSTTGYRFFTAFETFDPDGFDYPILIGGNETKGQQWSQEFRLNFEAGDRVTGFVGGSWFFEQGKQRAPLQFDERATFALFAGAITRPNPAPFAVVSSSAFQQAILAGFGVPAAQRPFLAAALKPAHLESFTNEGETTAIDLFGDVTVAVTDRLEVSGGLRWTQDDKETRFQSVLLNGPSTLAGILASAGAFAPGSTGLFAQPSAGVGVRSETFDDFTWRLVGRYAVNDALSTWASYARGRRPEVIVGASPTLSGGAVTFGVVPAEEVDSYEVGAKAALLDGALQLDASVFFYEYSNFQTTVFNGLRFVPTNAGEASATGFEAAAAWTVRDGTSIFANYAYNDAQFDSGARKGNRFRLSPENTFSVGATLAASVGTAGTLRLIPTYSWQSEIFFDDDNDRTDLQTPLSPALRDVAQDEKQGSYGLLNVRAEFLPEGTGLTFGAFVRNVMDEEYIIDAGNTGDTLGTPTFIRGAPRTVGVEVKAEF
ncbi:MAG: TonB-dependent receptor [Hyphomonadaceae bacterium]|nr:TonB-dependent receptor [Hyphomonadaceae bacterium]